MTVDEADWVVAFDEKPEHPPDIPGDSEHVLASMGVYVFSMSRLAERLHGDHSADYTHDFGRDIIPSFAGTHRVMASRFGGARGRVTADRYSIRTYEGQHPPARSVPGRSGQEAHILNCILASGTLVIGGTVRHTILFPSARVEERAVVENSLLFNGVTVGEGSQLQRCIVDKHVVIPKGYRFSEG